MNARYFVSLACLLISLLALGGSATAADPWEADIRKFEEQDQKTPPPEKPILFVGSSSIRFWDLGKSFPGLPAINRGFGGSMTSDVLRYVDRIVLKYRPSTIVFYSGDNDIASGKSPEQVAADFAALLKAIRAALPETKVVFLPTKPSLARWSLVDKQRDANQRIQALGKDDPRFVYADVAAPLLGPDGKPRPELFQADGLHLNDEGYKLWTVVVKPLVEPSEAK